MLLTVSVRRNYDKNILLDLIHVGYLVSSTASMHPPQTSVKVDLYIKEFSITLYTDNEDNNFLKTELIALYLDEITFFYTDKVDESILVVVFLFFKC